MLRRPSHLLLLLRHLSSSTRAVFPLPPNAHAADLWISKALSTSFLLFPSSLPLLFKRLHLSPLAASLAITRLQQVASTLSAFHFFLLTRDHLSITHSIPTYKLLINSLSLSGHMPDALNLFDEMLTACHYSPDESFLGFLIESCVANGLLDSALDLLSRAPHFGFQLGPSRYNNIMTGLVNSSRVKDAIIFFKDHLVLGQFTPDIWSFNIVLKAMCTLGDMNSALELLDEMRKLGYSPDIVTYNTLVNGLCKANQVNKAYSFLKRLRLKGLVVPNVITFTSVISSYCKLGKMNDARKVFDEMLHSGIKPNRVTYNVLIDGYGKNGDIHSACMMYDRMMHGGCPADIITITSLINGYCMNNQLDQAMRLWNEMGLKGLRPNVYTYSVMIHYLCKLNRLEDAIRFLDELTMREDIVPKAFVYNPVLDGLCRIGNVDKANRILTEMEKRKGYPDKYTYTILIIGYCMKGRMEDAITLFHRMFDTGCKPDNVATRSLVSCLLKAGLPNQASTIMSRLSFDNFSVKDDHLVLGRKIPEVSVAV
ncbi:Pentatricopeptide repeat-containing protein [Rhynchospora pubera]|uniref:Pentatricopeptide repeat-containing protein n=1 Tax=Rhynchospora pubera TaxID=906938 RepID=A0AAV8DF12_9POAL|nr:Pentatricopeptide repeat-containing protein [Rhynchospora pubera]